MAGTVDAVRHPVDISTESPSLFMLNVSAANAMPTLKIENVNANTLRLSWQGEITGWTLQENGHAE